MSLRNPLAASLLALALLATIDGCSKPESKAFHRVELTKEDLVSLFNVPVDRFQIEKFTWPFGHERYIRALIERSDDAGATWQVYQSIPRDLAVVEASVLYRLASPESPTTPRFASLHLRLGGRGIGFSGWSGSDFALELPAGVYTSESHFDDPERLLRISSGSRAYRLRLEAQDTPFAR